MKKIFAMVVAFTLCVPVFAFAESTNSAHATLNQLMIVVAALEAQVASIQNNQPLACAALFSKSAVHLHENVLLAWGSIGAIDPDVGSTSQTMWAQHGASTLSFDKAGTWKYSFNFYDQNGASTTCNALIRVTK